MKTPLMFLVVAFSLSTLSHAQEGDSLRWWRPQDRSGQLELEKALNAVPTPESLKAYHELFASEPHIAGTPGDARNIERLVEAFTELGLEVKVHEFWAYLAYPVDAAVEIIGAGENGANLTLSLREDVLEEDPDSGHADLTIGWNAYSGSDDVTGRIVYANYGTKADFEILRQHGIDLKGKIVLARYGGNFRGYKAKFAEQAGAAGLIIYTDPKDSGFSKGEVFPEGGWANETYIQRGSIKALNYAGDPLTPSVPATQHADRIDPTKVGLPRIPVQPIGYGAAKEILKRMKGRPLPPDLKDSWQGGFDFAYHLTGNNDLNVRLMVHQERKIRKTANVIATLKGGIYPDENIYVGCHHDAWGFGAGDPLAGTMLVFEAAKSFAQAAKAGHRPARSIVFANWGAEEYGIIGSTEYVEQYREELSEHTIAYINLDAATMGPNFHSSASPLLKQVIEDITKLIPQAGKEDETQVFEAWLGDRSVPSFGNLGGGSDHVGFYCHLGIPSCSLGAGGAPGSAYHSNYDNIAWYQQVVGADYEPALMLTRVVNLLTARLANATIIPFDPARYATDAREHLETLAKRAKELDVPLELAFLQIRINEYEKIARPIHERVEVNMRLGSLDDDVISKINETYRALEKQWLRERGLPERPWFKNLYAATDPTSGYAAWMFPGLRQAIEDKDVISIQYQSRLCLKALKDLAKIMKELDLLVPHQAME